MNHRLKSSVFLVVTALFSAFFVESYSKKDARIAFVQGGASEPGLGTKHHPYTTLAEAQADSSEWDILIVKSSPIALTGELTLQNGQKLIGEEDPTLIAVSPTQPTISNTSSSATGSTITAIGNVTIENIYFRDSYYSAINYDKAQDITVKNVLITNYDSGQKGNPAITGTSTLSGTTEFQNLIIRSSAPRSAGVYDEASSGTHREISFCKSHFTDLSFGDLKFDAIHAISVANSSSQVAIKNCSFQKNFGGALLENRNGKLSALVNSSTFREIAIGVSSLSSTAASTSIEIDNCLFTDLSRTGIIISDSGSSTSLVVKDSFLKAIEGGAVSSLVSDVTNNKQSVQKISLLNNTVSSNFFYLAENSSSPEPSSGQTEVTLQDNLYTGSRVVKTSGIGQWEKFTVDSEHNCFDGQGVEGSIAFEVANNLGDATIKAHNNSFANFATDINSHETDTLFIVDHNWWGHTPITPCNSGVCTQFQTCFNKRCEGPIVTPTTAKVFAHNPLSKSIECPHNCCKRLAVKE